MTTIAETFTQTAPRFARGLAQLAAQIGSAFATLPQAARASSELQRLSWMSDEELARRGTTRDALARDVMRRHFPTL
jgi:hypothetical protein